MPTRDGVHVAVADDGPFATVRVNGVVRQPIDVVIDGVTITLVPKPRVNQYHNPLPADFDPELERRRMAQGGCCGKYVADG